MPPPRRRGWSGRLLGLFTLGVLGAAVVQAVDYVSSLLATDPWLGWPFAIFLGMALFALTAFAAGEIADMRRLSRRASDPRGRGPDRRLRAARRGRAAAGRRWPPSSPTARCSRR